MILGSKSSPFWSADSFDELGWEAEEIIDAGDKVVVATRMTSTGKESEVQVSVCVFHVWTLSEGRGVELRTMFTREEAFQAAGLQ